MKSREEPSTRSNRAGDVLNTTKGCVAFNLCLRVEANDIPHYIPLEVVIENIYIASKKEQKEIKNILVYIDYKNGDVYHFFEHLATAVAARYQGVLA